MEEKNPTESRPACDEKPEDTDNPVHKEVQPDGADYPGEVDHADQHDGDVHHKEDAGQEEDPNNDMNEPKQ